MGKKVTGLTTPSGRTFRHTKGVPSIKEEECLRRMCRAVHKQLPLPFSSPPPPGPPSKRFAHRQPPCLLRRLSFCANSLPVFCCPLRFWQSSRGLFTETSV